LPKLILIRRQIILFLAVLVSFNVAFAQEGQKWKEAKSTHFVVYYKNAQDDFVDKLIEKSENYYNDIADDLGFRRYNFWLWDERAKVYICDNAKDYQAITGQPSWSSGCAKIKDKIMYTFPYAGGFFDTILPHELGHIIFREFVGFDNNAVPLWLDEGVASYQEKIKYSQAEIFLKRAIANGSFMSLEELSNFNPYFAANKELVQIFYFEAFGIVDYLIKEFGRDDFVSFCQSLRDRRDLNRALAANYPFSDIKELNQQWQRKLVK